MKAKRYKTIIFTVIIVACVALGIYVQNREKQYKSFFVERNNAGAVIAPTIDNQEEEIDEGEVKVNINTDYVYELMQLDGIGEKTAQRIIEFRKENGNFEVIEDLMRVEGIGEKKFEDIKENIYVE